MDYNKINLAVIGAGRWGFNHIKTANALLGAGLKYVCDVSDKTESKLKDAGINAKFTTNFDDVLNDVEINAVIISTSAETHFELAKKALLAGKNVLVEKPITLLTS